MDKTIKLVLVDDHVLLRNGLSGLVGSFPYCQVLFEANNGKDFMAKLDPANLPHIVLMDINMPVMDGYETAIWIKENHPSIKVLALSMYDNENAIIRMLGPESRDTFLKTASHRN